MVDSRERVVGCWIVHPIIRSFTFVKQPILMVQLHYFDEFVDALRRFGLKVLAIFHGPELVVHFEDERYEPFLVGLLVFVELDDSFLEDVEKRLDALVIDLFLGPGGKARVDGHSYGMK
jgi:hypothetical protein